MEGMPPLLGGSMYIDYDRELTLYVPAGTADAYKKANKWGRIKNIVEYESEPAQL